ncbi:hypothetical protein A3D05_05015 [Candidatus Gottesmanbacteria bacterium RIFCSPHIGHO2_02_FULL_40_24]|nr:MAG: hypothetical protein A3D05_05015 [Candidatus Gottesmanbacteria bacterium RIFCSPHIGHO2_02_FULL_40_24]OGG23223.1 MAG: hypothetical protein A3B48_00395 [Candidatus Gottesmanbacteria bacterium RIFCSPLOWO2_01_FULL_40_10]
MNKPYILILHGWNLSGKRFTPLVKFLNRMNFRAFSPDLPGFGRTQKPKKFYMLDDYCRFVNSFLDLKKINSVVLVGHSFGGRIAIKMAARYPQKIKAVILTGTPGLLPVKKVKVLFFLGLAKAGRLIFLLPFLSVLKKIFQKLLYRLSGAADYYHTDQRMRLTFQNIVREDLRGYLTEIGKPVFLLWGGRDRIVSPKIAVEMKNLVKGSELQIVDTQGHDFPYINPQIFSKKIAQFLKKIHAV